MGRFTVKKTENRARLGSFDTPHGTIQTPVFMNVATVGAIKGAVASGDLEDIDTQVVLCNTYHLHVRTGDELIKRMGGIRRFMSWNGPVLTDSGGFQVFSLSSLRKIHEDGVHFRSHIDGHSIFMGPEESIRIQSNLGSTIAMAFDECPSSKAEKQYVIESVKRTERWLLRCMEEQKRLNSLNDTVNRHQLLFGINQGAVFDDIRTENADFMSDLDLDGSAIGGLAVGETHEEMYHILDVTIPHLPDDRPVYLMGVGTPDNIVEAVYRGVDFFDCVYPSRNARHGQLYTHFGKLNLKNAAFAEDEGPIEEGCQCPACRRYSRAYLRHLLKAGEMLGLRLCVTHNLYFYNHLMEEIRTALENGQYEKFRQEFLANYNNGA